MSDVVGMLLSAVVGVLSGDLVDLSLGLGLGLGIKSRKIRFFLAWVVDRGCSGVSVGGGFDVCVGHCWHVALCCSFTYGEGCKRG